MTLDEKIKKYQDITKMEADEFREWYYKEFAKGYIPFGQQDYNVMVLIHLKQIRHNTREIKKLK